MAMLASGVDAWTGTKADISRLMRAGGETKTERIRNEK
jgi:hypothetical protein